MPCSGPTNEEFHRAEVDARTRDLCTACALLELNKIAMPEGLLYWWSRHKENDARRRVELAGEIRKKELKVQALAKMTDEERAAFQ